MGNEGTLAQLAKRLGELLPPDAAARATDAVAVLRLVNALRVGQQHSGTKPCQRQQEARRKLGLAEPSGDWSGDWQRIQHAVLDALRTLRNEISAASTAAP